MHRNTATCTLYMDQDTIREALLAETRALFNVLDKARKAGQDTTLKKESRRIPVLSGRSMQCRKTLMGHLAKVHSMSWGQNSRTLVTTSQDGKLLVWDCYTGYKINSILLACNWMMDCSLSPSGKLIAAGGLDCLCTLYAVSDDPQQLALLNNHDDFLSSCQFLDDNRLVTASGDCRVLLWDIETQIVTDEFYGHTDAILCSAVSLDKQMVVTGGYDGIAKVWDIRSKSCTHTFQAHEGEIHDAAFFPSGMAFGTGSEDYTCCLFDLRADQKLVSYDDENESQGPVFGIDFSKGGRLLFTACDDGTVRLWDTLKATFVGALYGHTANVSGVAVSPDGKAIATCSYDATVKIWN